MTRQANYRTEAIEANSRTEAKKEHESKYPEDYILNIWAPK